jgi:hypothetical protein
LAYIFAEPNDPTDDDTLEAYATSGGAAEWYSYFSAGPPNNNGGNYSNDLDVYAHQPSFINGSGNFVTPVTLSSSISQANFLFSTIEVSSEVVNPLLQYFYSIWLPLDGIDGTLNEYKIDLGTTPGGSDLLDNSPSVAPTTNAFDVIVTSGGAIPAGTYRVIWITPELIQPAATPLTGSLYFTGVFKN